MMNYALNLSQRIVRDGAQISKVIVAGLLMLISLSTFADTKNSNCPYLFKPVCQGLKQIWNEGSTDLYISGYAWHNRYTYSREWLNEKKYNERAWGGGLGKGLFDEKGNWHGIYAIAFLDSHKNVEPAVGYAYLWIASLTQEFKTGIGLSFLVTARPDINHNIPFPGVVPWAGIFFKQISLKAAYIPGTSSNGNVLYLVGTYSFKHS